MSGLTALKFGLLLVTPFNSTLFSPNSCLTQNFYGNYKHAQTTYSILKLPDLNCVESYPWLLEPPHLLIPSPDKQQRLVWLEQEDVSPDLLEQEKHNSKSFFSTLKGKLGASKIALLNQQTVMDDTYPSTLSTLYQSDSAILLALKSDDALSIDSQLPRFWKSSLIPETPSMYRTVSTAATARVISVLKDLKFDPDVASVVNNISIPQIRNDIRFLTGEDGKSGIISRHSFSPGALTAAQWIKDHIEDTGAACRLQPFLAGFAPNVICHYSAIKETNDTILISGHYDSRGSFGSISAPGADDDGSGTTGILSIARTIARKGVKFYTNVELVTFAGEEQGLLGSKAYARELRSTNASVILMIQADMTAYRAPGEPLQLGLPDRIGTPEVTQLVANVSALYSPELRVGFSAVCCSDHQSFIEQGFPATQVFERAGLIADPMYHNSGDVSNRSGYDFDQLYAIAKVQFATVLHTAGFELAGDL